MTIQAVASSMLMLPSPYQDFSTGGPSYNSILLSSSGQLGAAIIAAPRTGSIAKIGWRTGTVSVSGTGDLRVETVSLADGLPTGTLWSTNTNASISPSTSNAWHLTSLTASASVTRGDVLAIVWSYSSGSWAVSNMLEAIAQFPYTARYASSAWTKNSGGPVIALEYDDGSYPAVLGCSPFKAINNVTFNSGSSPNERGLKFRLPFPVRAVGFWGYWNLAGDTDVKLYDYDGSTVLRTVTLDKDLRRASNYEPQYQLFGSDVDLVANQSYRLTLVPGATNITASDYEVDTSAIMASLTFGADWHYTSRSGGSWTDAALRRIPMGLIVSGFDDGAGGVSAQVVRRRRRSFSLPPVVKQRRAISVSYPNVIQITAYPVIRPRKVRVNAVTVNYRRRSVIDVHQTFQQQFTKRRVRRTPTPNFTRRRRPFLPQASVTILQNVIVHRRRSIQHVNYDQTKRRTIFVNRVNYVPRRRHVIHPPPQVVAKRRRVTIELKTIQTALVVSRPRKVM